jgi:hypothetical protein
MPLPEPTFAGVWLGPICTTRTYANPVARQVNEYPGINGLEVLTMGSRGGTTEADGLLFGTSLDDLASRFCTFIDLQRDGGAYTLFDSLGTTWELVILVDFHPEGLVMQAPGGCVRAYRALFLHVI